MISSLRWLAVPTCMVAAIGAQWQTLPCAPVAPPDVTQSAFATYVDCNGHLYAYSAMGVGWRDLGVPDPTVPFAHGDWTGLVALSPVAYRAYSARLHTVADVSFVAPPIVVRVFDDVILLIGTRPGVGLQEALAYSAQTNTWVPYPAPVASLVTGSRFVCGLRAGDQAIGFSARQASWSSTPWVTGAALSSDGNVLLLDPPPPASVSAFSGVIGMWSPSPAQRTSSAAVIDHNVALIRAASGIGGRNCAYSAYTGAWTLGSSLAGVVRVTDNVVLVDQTGLIGAPSTLMAFGARPGTWASLSLAAGTAYTVHTGLARSDWVMVEDSTNQVLYAFSGVAGGSWQSRALPTYMATVKAGKSVFVAADGLADLHAFSALTNHWAPVQPLPGGFLTGQFEVRSCYALAFGAGNRTVYSGRFDVWSAGPPMVGASTHDFGGSTFAMHDAGTGQLTYWHERTNTWKSLTPGFAGPPTILVDRNVAVVDYSGSGGDILGISAQRGDVRSLSGAIPSPPAVAPDQNVACVVDTLHMAHALGSPNATHSFFQYPLDSEFQTYILPGAPPLPSKTMVRGTPGDAVSVVFSTAPSSLVLPFGTLYCDILSAPYFTLPAPAPGVLGADGLLSVPVLLAAPAVVATLELCAQGFTVGPTGLHLVGSAPEPVRWR
ncbi:MAG: hypothetical protein R3F56_20610 [Planctomycetota bacterium]